MLTTPCTILVPGRRGAGHHRQECRQAASAECWPRRPTDRRRPRPTLILHDSDIFIIPDVLCNAGGVTVSYFEWVQDIQQFLWSEEQVNQKLEELMFKAFHQVRQLAKERKPAHAHGRAEPRRAEGRQGEGAARVVSVTTIAGWESGGPCESFADVSPLIRFAIE